MTTTTVEIPKIKLEGDAEEALKAKVSVLELRMERYRQIAAAANQVIQEAQQRAQKAASERKRAQEELTASDASLRASCARWLKESGHDLPEDAIAVAVRDGEGRLTGEITWEAPGQDPAPEKPKTPAQKAAGGRKKAAKKRTGKR